jgi:8-oxo-dGTP pyrophosphatase MutT (NUDIX family)
MHSRLFPNSTFSFIHRIISATSLHVPLISSSQIIRSARFTPFQQISIRLKHHIHRSALDPGMNNPYAGLTLLPPSDGILSHAIDRYSGVTIPDSTLLTIPDIQTFELLLQSSLTEWIRSHRRGIWMQVPVEKSAFIQSAVREGFQCHHAQPNYIMLTAWLPEIIYKRTQKNNELTTSKPDSQVNAAAADTAANVPAATNAAASAASASVSSSSAVPPFEPSMIPAYATHSLGIGCAVFNSLGQILVIQERFAHPTLPDFWKLPGGAVDAGEELPQAAVREVSEETGVACTFRSLIGFRHLTNYRFGTGDLYFIATCTVDESSGIPAPIPQPEEVSAAEWWDLQEFLVFHSTRWMQDLVREPLLQEWQKAYPNRLLPPPPTVERIKQLQTLPPHPKSSEGKTWPSIPSPQAPPPGSSVGFPATRIKSTLSSTESLFYVCAPVTQLRGEAARAAKEAADTAANAAAKQ